MTVLSRRSFLVFVVLACVGSAVLFMRNAFRTRSVEATRGEGGPALEAAEPILAKPRESIAEDNARLQMPLVPSAHTGYVQLLDSGRLTPVSNNPWRAVLAPPHTALDVPRAERTGISSADGTLELPPGEWKLFELGDYVALPDVVSVRPSGVTVLCVSRLGRITLDVRNLAGNPLSGATACFRRKVDDDVYGIPRPPAPSARGTSDANGRLVLDDCPIAPGDVLVSLGGYKDCRLGIRGVPAPVYVVQLTPSAAPSLQLRVVSWSSDLPIDSAKVTLVNSTHTTNADGIAVVPSAVGQDGAIVSAAGHCAARVDDWPKDGTLALHEASEVSVTATDTFGVQCDAYLFVDVNDVAPSEGCRLAIDDIYELKAHTPAVIALPLSQNVALYATTPAGETGSYVFVPSAKQAEVKLQLASTPGLDIDVQGEEGRIMNAVAYVRTRRDGILRMQSNGAGVLHVGDLGQCNRIDIHAPGYRSMGLEPLPESAAEQRVGRLTLTMHRSIKASLQAVDQDGVAIAGLFMRLWPTATGIHQFPDLGGRWPTGHAAWLEDSPRAEQGITDARGTWRPSEVGTGTYDLEFSLPPVYGAGDGPQTLYPTTIQTARLGGGANDVALRFVVYRPRYIALEVIEGISGLPVPSVQVAAGGAPGMVTPGNLWDGWISDKASVLTVVAPGVGQSQVSCASLSDAVARVLVWPDNPSAIELVGDNASKLVGQTVIVDLKEVQGNSAFSFASVAVRIDENASAKLFVPYSETIEVSVRSIDIESGKFAFSPRSQLWRPDATLRFSVDTLGE